MPASVDLVTPVLTVAPGATVTTTVRLGNTGRIVDELTIEVLGDAAPYATVEPAVLPLFPGARGEVTITFRPPRGTTPLAGTVAYGVRVRSKEDRAFSFVAEGTVTVGAFLDVAAHLAPRTSVGSRFGQSGRHRVELTNGGNATAQLRLAATDPDERLTFKIAQPVISLPPGGRAITTIAVKGRKRMLTGAQTLLPFQVFVAPDGAAPITLDGSFSQRPTLVGGTSQILTLAVVIGVVGVLATQAVPLLTGAKASPSPVAPSALPTLVAGSIAPSATAAPPSTLPQPSTAPPSSVAPSITDSPSPTTAPVTSAPVSVVPSVSISPSPSPTPLAIKIFGLGLVDPNAQPPEQTPTPEPTEAPTAPPGGTIPPIRVFPSFPLRVILVPVGQAASQPALAAGQAFTQDQQPGLPVQQFGIQAAGPVSAVIKHVSDSTTPTLCLAQAGGNPQCQNTTQPLPGNPPGTDVQTWFVSVTAVQGGTNVDMEIDYAPQSVTVAFKDLHLAGVSAGSGVHLVMQASSAGLIEISTEVNIAADVTVSLRDLNTQVAAPPSTTPAGVAGGPFLAAAEAGHLYDIVLSSSSPDEVFVSGTISWP